MITGGCLCGAVRYEADVPLEGVHYCHCRMCQQASGSAFAMFGGLARAQFRFTKGGPKWFPTSAFARRGFCPDCGSPLVFTYNDKPDRIGVTVGSLDRPDLVAPGTHWGVEGQLPWLHVADDLPHKRTEEDADWQAALASVKARGG